MKNKTSGLMYFFFLVDIALFAWLKGLFLFLLFLYSCVFLYFYFNKEKNSQYNLYVKKTFDFFAAALSIFATAFLIFVFNSIAPLIAKDDLAEPSELWENIKLAAGCLIVSFPALMLLYYIIKNLYLKFARR
jgi:hypothetical protein